MATMRFPKLFLPGFWVTLFFLNVGAPAQERYGELNGTITDRSNAVVPHATVTAIHKDTNRVLTTETSQDGKYVIRNLDPGRFNVSVEARGFIPLEYQDVIVLTGKVLTINGQLEVGGAQETVIVTTENPLIDMTTTLVGHNVTRDEFDRLPKTRSFQSLAGLSPSVNAGDVVEGGGMMINGASAAENQFNVDGLSTNSLIYGSSRQNAAFEILDEVQVKTAGIEAQYGGALGGVVSAVTRSGGDSFHGDVHYYLAGSPLNAGPSKRLWMNPSDLKTVTYIQDYEHQSDRHEAGYSLGGYFIKKRLYFFSAASPQFITEARDYLAADQTPVTLYRDQRYWQAYNKISADITQRLRFTIGYLWSPFNSEGNYVGYNGIANQLTSSAAAVRAYQAQGFFNPQSNYNAGLDWTISPTSMLNLKAARYWDNFKKLGIPNKSAIEWGTPSVGIAGLDPSLQQPQGYATIPRMQTTLFDIATRNLIQGDFSRLLTLGGSHDFKVGIGRQKNVSKVDNSYPGGGYITLYWNSALIVPGVGTTSGKYGYYRSDDMGTKGSTGGTIDHIYLQDRWKITSQLSIDAGVRLEKEVVPSFRRDIKEYAFEFGWGEKVAPRLGASYDLFGNGKVKIYGSWGRFYDWVKYELSRGTFGGDVWRTYYRPIDSLDTSYILGLGNGNLPGQNLWITKFQDWRIPSFGPDSIDPGIKPMSTWIANTGVEWQVASQLVLAARYTHNALRYAIEDMGELVEGSEVYVYGNPGYGIQATILPSTATAPTRVPHAKRVYDSLELSFTRRFSSRWLASGSYVYSRLWGDYAGLQNTDEINPGATGRASTTAQQIGTSIARPGTAGSRAYDSDTLLWDSHGNMDMVGRLSGDRPHVLKLYGSYTLPKTLPFLSGTTQVGAFFRANSGVPMSTLVQDTQSVPMFVNGRGDLGRTPFFTNTDLEVSHELKIKEGRIVRFEFNLQNLFNQRISQYTYPFYNRFLIGSSEIDMTHVNLAQGYDYQAMLAATPDAAKSTGALDPRFGYADNLSPGFAGRFGIKFSF